MDRSGLLPLSAERQGQVDAVLARFFSLSKNRAAAFGPQYVQLWQTLENNTIGGKRFRPRMVMAAYEALGGRDTEAAAYENCRALPDALFLPTVQSLAGG